VAGVWGFKKGEVGGGEGGIVGMETVNEGCEAIEEEVLALRLWKYYGRCEVDEAGVEGEEGGIGGLYVEAPRGFYGFKVVRKVGGEGLGYEHTRGKGDNLLAAVGVVEDYVFAVEGGGNYHDGRGWKGLFKCCGTPTFR